MVGINYQQLAERIGEEHLRKRLDRQVNLASKFYAKGSYATFHLENVEPIYILLKYILKILGIYQRGLGNAVDYRVEKIQVWATKLPPAFNGFRILQLSDIHADGIPDKGKRLGEILKQINVDLCVLTGDFRFSTQDTYIQALKQTGRIVQNIDAAYGIWGILGNHDFIEFVPGLEDCGVKMLLNEAVPIRKNGAVLWLAGIDDAHLYDCQAIVKTLKKIPQKHFTIMLSHTPETYAEAAAAGVDYLMCGHTHGGQICLPGGIPLITNASCPRSYCAGFWRYNNMQGYTSRAAGSSGLPVRFFCPPEITIHELMAKKI
ncbi:MAG: metallophosphoesterase [Desulfobacterales bacterium]